MRVNKAAKELRALLAKLESSCWHMDVKQTHKIRHLLSAALREAAEAQKEKDAKKMDALRCEKNSEWDNACRQGAAAIRRGR